VKKIGQYRTISKELRIKNSGTLRVATDFSFFWNQKE